MWWKFWFGQLVQLLATVLGWFILIPFCIFKAWKIDGARSIKDGRRTIDQWSWKWLNLVYGNPEDGVSGYWAVLADGTHYNPTNSRWGAYCWSAWRNSCDNLKYVFSNNSGPLVEQWWHLKVGYQEENGFRVPVLSFKKG